MPAIQPERLQRQGAELAKHFDSPGKFLQELDHLFEFYADRATTSEETVSSHTELPSFNPPSQLIYHIQTDLQPLIKTSPEKAFELAEDLWNHQIHESRLLAAYILGTIEHETNASYEDHFLPQLFDRITLWRNTFPDDELLIALAEDGLAYLRRTHPDLLLDQIDVWAKSGERSAVSFGLIALKKLLQEPDYENLPRIFTILTPLVQQVERLTRAELRAVVKACAARSAVETVKFLEKLSSSADPKPFRWLIRNSSSYFPSEMGERLRKLKGVSASE